MCSRADKPLLARLNNKTTPVPSQLARLEHMGRREGCVRALESPKKLMKSLKCFSPPSYARTVAGMDQQVSPTSTHSSSVLGEKNKECKKGDEPPRTKNKPHRVTTQVFFTDPGSNRITINLDEKSKEFVVATHPECSRAEKISTIRPRDTICAPATSHRRTASTPLEVENVP